MHILKRGKAKSRLHAIMATFPARGVLYSIFISYPFCNIENGRNYENNVVFPIIVGFWTRRFCARALYINLEQAIFSEGDDSEYTTRIAKTIKGARALLAAGFDYVTDMNGYKLFRKRK